IARTSTFAYKGQAADLRKVAGDLGVRYVLEGSVRSGGNRLRITAQLIDASDGSHIWAERFDRTPDDLFDIQDEITKEIVTALRVHLTDGEEAAILARGTNDIEAWQLCMRASELQMKFNATDYLEARALAERALARDPNYAYAWGTLGFTYWWDGRLGFTGDSAAKFARAAECAERAMAIDDTVSWAICLSVMAAAPLGRQEEALEMARRGIAHHPGNADVRAILAFALINAGHYEDSLEHFRAAMALNPFHPNWYRTGFARALMFLDQMEAALAPIEEIMASEPSNLQAWLMRGYIYGRTGRVDEARADVDRARRLAPDLRVGNLTGLLLIGDEESAERFRAGLSAIGLPE
ncbi:MAG: tetratricopeptide repeat protein, partial [Acidobacteria bacterium]|nr:tetratricopeptide repeat protein [Acidobacteriota bacterium]